MRRNLTMCAMRILFLALAASFLPSSTAEILIEGAVTLPPAKPVSAAFARYAQKAGKVAPPEPPRAVVYLEGPFPKGAIQASGAASVVQTNYQFAPAILPIQKGASVEFPNQDDDYHHVFSYSKAKEFDVGRFRKDEKPPAVVFDKTGVVKIGCEIHDHMRAFVLVLDTPYFTRTETNGAYRLLIKEPLSGTFALKAWIDDKTVREQSIELKDGASVKVDFPAK